MAFLGKKREGGVCCQKRKCFIFSICILFVYFRLPSPLPSVHIKRPLSGRLPLGGLGGGQKSQKIASPKCGVASATTISGR